MMNMFAFSYQKYGHVPEGFPGLFSHFLRPLFKSPMAPAHGPRPLINKRALWAQAEMFVTYKLSSGTHPDCLERMIEEEVDISCHTGDYNPLFLQFCLRIIRNMRSAGLFSDFLESVAVQEAINRSLSEENPINQANHKLFDTTIVGRYGMDREIANEIDQCDYLDKETQANLQELRKKLHREAERNWHVKAAETLYDQYNRDEDPRSGNTNSPSRRAYTTRRVEFPDESTMTESSTAAPLRDSGRYTAYTLNAERDRGSVSCPRTTTPDSNFQGGGTNSVRPEDSVSQFRSFNGPSREADFSRLRANSPPNTSNRSNDGFSSRVSSEYSYSKSEWSFAEDRSRTRLQQNNPQRRSNGLRSIFKEPRVDDEAFHHSKFRHEERVYGGRHEIGRDSSHDSRDLNSEIGHRLHRSQENVSRVRFEREFIRQDRNISRSPDAPVPTAPRKSEKSRGKEREENPGHDTRFEDQSRAEDRNSRLRHCSDLFVSESETPLGQHESRQQNEPQRAQDLNNPGFRESRNRSDLLPLRSSQMHDRHESRSGDRSDSQPRYRYSMGGSGPPNSYSRVYSRPAATVHTQISSETDSSYIPGRLHNTKRSNDGPLKIR